MAGSSILPMDMRRADLAYGSPELMLAGMGAVDYFNSIGRPSWVGAGCSDFHLPDMQAAAEVGSNMAHRFAAGIAVDDETLAFDAVKRCASDNGFITDDHTIERYETERWLPGLFERSDVDLWNEGGGRKLGEKIKDRLSDLLR